MMRAWMSLLSLLGLLLASGCVATGDNTAPSTSSAETRADVQTQLALGYLQRDQKETALEALQDALAIAPDHSRSNYVMAMLQSELGNEDKADRHYRRALRSNPDNSSAAHDYAIFLCQRGRVEQAMEHFQSALDNPLYDRKALTNLRAGECLVRMRTDRRGAEPYFRAALDANSRLAPALYHMADIAYARGEYLAARGYIERYFSTARDTPESLLLAVKIETKLNADDVAKDYAARLKKQFGSSDEARQLKIYQ